MRWWKWLLLVLVLVVVSAAVAGPAMSWWQQRAATRYLTATVSRGRIETVVNSTGTVKPVRTVSVGAFTSGPVAEVNVDYNSKVYKKHLFWPATVMARIDPKLSQAAVDRDAAAVEAQEADLQRLEALLEQAQINQQRAQKLKDAGLKVKEDYISATELDQFAYSTLTYLAQVKLSKASIRQARATLQNSRENLAYTDILAPEDGIVIERKVDPGQTVQAQFQTPELFTIGLEMDQHVHVYASVDEADIGLIRTAQEQNRLATFTVDSYPGHLFDGRVYQIRMNATTTQNVVTYPVILDAPNRDLKLMPNMTANISFQIESKDDVLRVPVAALRYVPQPGQVRLEDRHYVEIPAGATDSLRRTANEKAEQSRSRQRRVVWVQDGPLLRAVPVTLGLIENQVAELVSGELAEGQVVVTGTESPFAPR